MLHYNRIDLSEGTDVTKSRNSKNTRFVTIGVTIMGISFEILFVMFVCNDRWYI